MFKRPAIFFAVLAFAAVSLTALGQGPAPFAVDAVRQSSDGLDRIFEFDVSNKTDRALSAGGRVVLLNVYDSSLPATIPVTDLRFAAAGKATVSAHWNGAPLVGQIRALLVLNDGTDPSLIQPFTFWVFPWSQAAIFAGLLALLVLLALGILRLPRYLKSRVPANMIAYVAEDDDTVVTLSTRFDVSWQDIVRANRLKPPYVLKTGGRVLIPKHGLRRPEQNP